MIHNHWCAHGGGAGIISPPPPGHNGGGGIILVFSPHLEKSCAHMYKAVIRFSSNILSAPNQLSYFVPIELN